MKIEKSTVYPDDTDGQQMIIDKLILELGKLEFRLYSIFDYHDDADYWDVYLCYGESHEIIAFAILSYGHNGYDFYEDHVSSATYVLTHLQVKKSERHKCVGTYLMQYIRNDTDKNIFMCSIKDTYMFYLSCGAYVLNDDFVQGSSLMVIPNRNHSHDTEKSSYENIYAFMNELLCKDFEPKFIQSSASITQFYIDEYYCKTCGTWKKYHEESDSICGCLCII